MEQNNETQTWRAWVVSRAMQLLRLVLLQQHEQQQHGTEEPVTLTPQPRTTTPIVVTLTPQEQLTLSHPEQVQTLQERSHTSIVQQTPEQQVMQEHRANHGDTLTVYADGTAFWTGQPQAHP